MIRSLRVNDKNFKQLDNLSSSYRVQKLSADTMSSDCEVCSVIKFLSAEGINGHKIHQRLCEVFGKGNVILLRSFYQ